MRALSCQLAQKFHPDRLGLGRTDSMPSTSRRPSVFTPTAMITDRDDRAPAPDLQLVASIQRYGHSPSLLILDDLTSRDRGQGGTSALFEMISARYEHRSIMITANQPFGEWSRTFRDPAMTFAAADRLVHHAANFEMNVESYRRKTALEEKRRRGRLSSFVNRDVQPRASIHAAQDRFNLRSREKQSCCHIACLRSREPAERGRYVPAPRTTRILTCTR